MARFQVVMLASILPECLELRCIDDTILIQVETREQPGITLEFRSVHPAIGVHVMPKQKSFISSPSKRMGML
jgi:hypothetical protein